MLLIAGRVLLALLFLAGAGQKWISPETAMGLLAKLGWPQWLVWPAMLYNALAGLALLAGFAIRWVAISLAVYCMVTSVFHLQPDNDWQISIFVKNWAIAGGLLVLAESRHRTS